MSKSIPTNYHPELHREQKFLVNGLTVEIFNFIFSMGRVVALELRIDGIIYPCELDYFMAQEKKEII